MGTKESLRSAMDRRLSFLDDLPSCRAALRIRIAQEEAPVMKKKISVGFVFAMVLVLLSVAALAASLLISPRVSASRAADLALKEKYGITAEMQTFFAREEQELPDGAFRVSYTGVSDLEAVLGTYAAVVKDRQAEVSWSLEGEDTSGGYEANAWGIDQLKQMMEDSVKGDKSYLQKARDLSDRNAVRDPDLDSSTPEEGYPENREAAKAAAFRARKLSEEEMITLAQEFVINSYELNEEQVARMERYVPDFIFTESDSYEMVNGRPCFEVEYLLYTEYASGQESENEPRPRTEKDGYYKVFVNVETGAIEEYEYNSALAGEG